MSRPTVLIGVGNPYRRDDGIGPALVAEVSGLGLDGLTAVTCDGEPSRLLDAWSGAALVVLVDAAVRESGGRGEPGRIRRCVLLPAPAGEALPASSTSTHGLGVAEALRLGQALDRLPDRLVAFTVEAGEIGHGPDLSAPVAASLPSLTTAVLAELEVSQP